jgi:hypothetical protein
MHARATGYAQTYRRWPVSGVLPVCICLPSPAALCRRNGKFRASSEITRIIKKKRCGARRGRCGLTSRENLWRWLRGWLQNSTVRRDEPAGALRAWRRPPRTTPCPGLAPVHNRRTKHAYIQQQRPTSKGEGASTAQGQPTGEILRAAACGRCGTCFVQPKRCSTYGSRLIPQTEPIWLEA